MRKNSNLAIEGRQEEKKAVLVLVEG